jgi:DNA replication protein DnaC
MDFTNTEPWQEDNEDCKLCGGSKSVEVFVSGSIRIEPCKCATQEIARKRIINAGIPKRFYEWDLRNLQRGFRIKNKDSLAIVKHYINHLPKRIREGKGLWVSAPAGLGKNSLLCYILRLALEKNYRAYYAKAQKIINIKLDSWRDRDSRSLLYRLTEGSHIVAIADIEKGPIGNNLDDFRVQNFYDVVSDIDDSKTPLLISSNMPKMDVLKRMPGFMQIRFRPLKEVVLRYSHGMNGGIQRG